jgi:hypothetical protein
LAHIARVGSVLATLTVTIERFIAVAYPLKRMTKNTSISLMKFSILIAIVYNVPRFFEFETVIQGGSEEDISNAMATNPTNNVDLLKVGININKADT